MKRVSLLLAVIVGFSPLPSPLSTLMAADTLFVAAIAEPGGDGQSWNTAFRSLSDAVTAWQSGDEIWVAKGTYPIQSRIRLEAQHSGIQIYGGFFGNETKREARDWFRSPSILKGSKFFGPIMLLEDCDSLTRIDGLHFTDANTAVGVFGGAPHFRNCAFRNNSCDSSAGTGSGGAMMISNVNRMRIEYCTFENNEAQGLGGAIVVMGQKDPSEYGFGVLIGQCAFVGNKAGYGGAVYFMVGEAIPQITSCVFYNNTSTARGGAVGSMQSWVYITNSTFAKNSSPEGMSVILHGGSIQNSIFWNGDLADNAKHIVDYDGDVPNDTNTFTSNANLVEKDFDLGFWQNDPQFEAIDNPAGEDGFYGTDDDGLRLSSFSLVRNAGVIDRFVNHRQTDMIGSPRLVGNKNDLGAYESQRSGRPGYREMMDEIKQGKLTFFYRHAKTDWDQKDQGPSPECFPGRNLIYEGRQQAINMGKAYVFNGVPVGDVESSPVCRCWETALLITGRYEIKSYWGSGGGQDVIKKRDSVFSTVPTGGNRIITSHDAVANLMFNPDGDGRDLTSAELMEGDCLFLRAENDTFAVVGQWCSDTWERFHVRFPDLTSVNDGPCYAAIVKGIVVNPMPATNDVYISTEDWDSYSVSDITGRVIYQTPQGYNFSVNVSSWPSGLYIVRGGNASSTFLVTH